MSATCAVSKSLALSDVLRSILRFGIASDLYLRPSFISAAKHPFPPYSRRPPVQSLHHTRYFTSSSTLYDSSIQQSIPMPTEPQSGKQDRSQNVPAIFDELVNSSIETKDGGFGKDNATKSKTSKEHKMKKSRKERSKKNEDDEKPKDSSGKKKPEHWKIQKAALREKFKGGWNPTKKLSPDALDGIRHLHATAPEKFTTPVLAEHFKVSPEAIRRILSSKWQPSETERENRRKRWEKRHDRIWSHMSELGLRPKRKRLEEISDARILKGPGEDDTTI